MENTIPTPSSNPWTASHPWTARAFLIAVLAWCAIPLSPNGADEDFWGHVQYGRDLWREGLPQTGSYNFTAVDHRWINHENLSELVFALLVDYVGPASVLVLKCALGLGVLSLMVWRSRVRNVHVGFIAFACVLVSINLSFYWNCRPQLFSFCLFAAMITLVDYAFHEQENEPTIRCLPLCLVIPLLWVWANTHGGFLAGCALLVVLIGVSAAELLVGGRIGVRTAAILMSIAIAGVLVTFVNPYGWDLHVWLWESLSVPRPEVPEWHPPAWFAAGSWKLWALVGAATFGFAASKQRRSFAQLALLALIFWQVTKHQRHIPFFAILIGFWLPVHFQSAWRRLFVGTSIAEAHVEGRLPAAQFAAYHRLVVCSMLALTLIFGVTVAKRLREIRVKLDHYPVSAVQYAADHRLSGRILVTAKWGQYVLATLGTSLGDERLLVAFDGRFRTCYPQQIVDMHFDFILGNEDRSRRHRSPGSPTPDPMRALRFGRPDYVLIDRAETHAVQLMASNDAEWTLLYQDQLAQLWGRSTRVNDPESPAFIEFSERIIGNTQQTGHVRWPAAPKQARSTPQLVQRSRLKSKTVFTGN